MVDDEVTFRDEVVVIDGDLLTEIVDERREDLLPTLSALRTPKVVFTPCGVVHQIFGDELVDDGVVTRDHSTKQLVDHVLGLPTVHPLMMPDPADDEGSPVAENPWGDSSSRPGVPEESC